MKTLLAAKTTNLEPTSLTDLTKALTAILQELEIESPQTISVFLHGTEVYRYRSTDGSTIWWGINDAGTPASNKLISTHSQG